MIASDGSGVQKMVTRFNNPVEGDNLPDSLRSSGGSGSLRGSLRNSLRNSLPRQRNTIGILPAGVLESPAAEQTRVQARPIAHPVWDRHDLGHLESQWADELAEQQQAAAFAKVNQRHADGHMGGADEFEEPEHPSICGKVKALGGPGNIAAGAASALHVNLYVAALGMMLATKYFDVMSSTMVAVWGTMFMQAVHTFWGSYNHFVISNADTVPGAVLVEIIGVVVETCEREWKLTHAHLLETLSSGTVKDWEECLKDHPELCKACWADEECWMEVHSTVVVAVMLCSGVTGLILTLIGKWKWGNLICFVPLTVQAAFLAGVGWKIAKTGVLFLVDKKSIMEGKVDPFMLLTNAAPVLGMGVFIMMAEKSFHHSRFGEWTLPALLIGLTGVFYAFVWLLLVDDNHSWDYVMDQARMPGDGEMFPKLPDGQSWLMDASGVAKYNPFPQFFPVWDHANKTANEIAETKVTIGSTGINFDAIFTTGQLINVVILVVVTILSILINSTAIEEETGSNIDFDRELKVTGVGNVLSACICGPIGYSSVGKTMLCHSMGGHYYSGLFSIAYYCFYILFVFYFFGLIPLPVLGAFIFAIGTELLLEWLVAFRNKVSRTEYWETLVLFAIMTLNFVAGFFVGMFFSLIAFASRYADVPVIKAVMDGSEYQGRSSFSGHDTIVLKKWGCKILTVRLQGFIFFFTAERLRLDLLRLIQSPSRTGTRKIEYLILDFRFVDNLDTTAIQKLRKLLRTSEIEFGISCMITNLRATLKARMEMLGGEIECVMTDMEDIQPEGVLSSSRAMDRSTENGSRAAAPAPMPLKNTQKKRSKDEHLLRVSSPRAASSWDYSQGDYSQGNSHSHSHCEAGAVGDGRDSGGDDDGHQHGEHHHHQHHHEVGWGGLVYLTDSDDAVELALECLLAQPKYSPHLIIKDDSCRRAGRWTLSCIVKGIIDYQRAGMGALVAGQLFDSASFRAMGRQVTKQRGDIIQKQDEWSHRTIWYIVRGKVAGFRKHFDGTVSKTELRHRGTIAGEVGFFLDQPRHATFQAVEDETELIEFTFENYQQLAKEMPILAQHLHVYVIEMQTRCISRQAHEINLLLSPAKGLDYN